MGELLHAFRRTLARIEEIERNMRAEQVEISTLRGEIEELRGALRADPTTESAVLQAVEQPTRNRPIRQKSSVGWAKRVLEMAGGPMYVDEIISNIEHMTGNRIVKATLVSNLSRYVKAGDTFKRTGANTFALLTYEEPEKEIRLVG